MLLVYGYLLSWMAGGIGLLTVLLLRTERRPTALLLALVGFGGAGFVAQGIGLGTWRETLSCAGVGAVALGALGYLLQPRNRTRVPP